MFRDLLSAFGLGAKKVNVILAKDDSSDLSKLEDLLLEDDTLNECKSQNQKLFEFLSKKENMSTLIRFATRFPGDDISKDRAHR